MKTASRDLIWNYHYGKRGRRGDRGLGADEADARKRKGKRRRSGVDLTTANPTDLMTSYLCR